jgi:hypothetical protein
MLVGLHEESSLLLVDLNQNLNSLCAQVLVILPNIKYYGNMQRHSRVVTCGQTYGEANRRIFETSHCKRFRMFRVFFFHAFFNFQLVFIFSKNNHGV